MNPTSADARTPDPKAEARRLRWENRARVEAIRAAELAVVEKRAGRRRDLAEAYAANWVAPYVDYLDQVRRREVAGGGATGYSTRRGRNYPIYQTETELALLRAPARVLCATNGHAIGLLEGLTSYVVNTGYTYRAVPRGDDPLPDGLAESAQAVVDEFLDRTEWHGGELPGLEEELFQRSIEDGEFLLRTYRLAGGRTDVRTVEPEQLTLPPGGDFREWSFGVRTEPTDPQRPLAYWLQYGDSPADGEEVRPDELTHFRRNCKRSMKRGVTDFCFDTYDSLDFAASIRITLADATVQQAGIVGVRQHQTASQSEVQRFVDDDADWRDRDPSTGRETPTRKARRPGWEDVPEGLAYVSGPGAGNAPSHLAVLSACLRGAGVRWNAPEWLASGDASNNNYASSLTAESPFVITVKRRQRAYKEAFRRVVLMALGHAADSGLVRDEAGRAWAWRDLCEVLDLVCEAPSPEVRDKQAEANTAAVEIPLGLDSRQQYVQRQGREWDRVRRDNEDYLAETGGGPPTLGDPPGGE